MNSYELSKAYFNFSFENPEKISPGHAAVFFFAVEHCNRLGWKEKFGFPTQMAMEAIGIKKHQTYIKYFNDLVEWGFFKLIQKSQNQYSSNIISLISAMPKNGKAMDKAIVNHMAKQRQSTGQSKDSIIKQDNLITNNINSSGSIEPVNTKSKLDLLKERKNNFKEELKIYLDNPYSKDLLNNFYMYWTESNKSQTKMRYEQEKTFEIRLRLQRWAANDFNKPSQNNDNGSGIIVKV